MAHSRSIWAQSSMPTRVVAGVVVIVGFVFLFSIVDIFGNRISLLANFVFALVSPAMCAVAFLFLSIGLIRIRQEHVAWHKEQNFLQGIAYAFLALTSFMTLLLINNILPHLLAFILGITFGTLALLCIMRSILVNQVNLRR